MSTPDPEETELASKLRRVRDSSDMERWPEAREALTEAMHALAARRLSESGSVDLDAIRARTSDLIARLREEAYYIRTPEPTARLFNEAADALDEVERLRLSESESTARVLATMSKHPVSPEVIAQVEARKGEQLSVGHHFLGVYGHDDDDECTFRADGTDATYCGLTDAAHYPFTVDEAHNWANESQNTTAPVKRRMVSESEIRRDQAETFPWAVRSTQTGRRPFALFIHEEDAQTFADDSPTLEVIPTPSPETEQENTR